jgi:geranylgeranyl diphosphate synthase type II
MDNAPIRRGKPTVHEKWNANTAILSGDTMMALSYDYIMEAPDEIINEVFSVFNKTAIQVCEGQQYDMNFETQENISIPDYINMIRLKTAVLLAGSLKIGALIGGAGIQDATRLYRFGENLGIAFQLKDDLLDTFSEEDKFGKKTGGDIVANKKTFLYLKAFEKAGSNHLEELNLYYKSDFKNPEKKIREVTRIYKELAVDRITLEEMDHYYSLAMNDLNEIRLPENKKIPLIRFAGQLKQREK